MEQGKPPLKVLPLREISSVGQLGRSRIQVAKPLSVKGEYLYAIRQNFHNQQQP